MTLRVWKHVVVVIAAIGGVGAVVAGAMGEVIASAVGTVMVIVLSAVRYFLGEAEKKHKLGPERAETQQARSVERGQSIVVPTSAGEGDSHDEITEAFRYVAEGRPNTAIDRLTELKRRRWDQLSPRARYRLLANRGSAKLASQEPTAAARDYIRALDYQPSDEDARSFAGLGHFLLGEVERARELAIELCREHPALHRAQVIRIRTTPKDVSLDRLRESVPTAVLSMPDVALALHDRAHEEGRLGEAERFLRDSMESAEQDWAPVTLALGSTILEQEMAVLRTTPEGPLVSDRSRLEEAEKLLTIGIGQIQKVGAEAVAFGAYMNRGTAHTLLGQHRQAREDFRKARQIRPAESDVPLSLARSVYLDRRDLDEGIRILEDYLAEHASESVELLLAEFLRQRAQGGDLERAADILTRQLPRLADLEDEEQRANVVVMLVDVYARTNQAERVLKVFDEVPEAVLSGAPRAAILGDTLRKLGRREEARMEALRARDLLGDSSNWTKVGRVAVLLESLGEHEEAFKLWRRIVVPEFVSPETYSLLHCAKEAGEHRFILDFCHALRERGHFDHHCLAREVEALIQYGEYARAREVLVQYLDTRPHDKVAQLNLARLAILLGWTDVLETFSFDLPTVEELDNAGIGGAVADVLRMGPDPTQAADYAYDLYRRFPDDPEAHRALIVSILVPGPAGLRIEKPEAVTPGTAVCYREAGSEERHWVVIEDSGDPSISRGEYQVSHPLVQAVLGKTVGDEFPLPERSIREVRGTVLETLDKRVYRANDLLTHWGERFPDQPAFVSVPVRVSDVPSPEDYSEITKIMKGLTERREQVERVYAEGKLPIATMALFNGKTVLETVDYLGANPELSVRACQGASQDFEQALQLLDNTEFVVLAPSAIATLALLEEVDILAVLPFRLLVTEATVRELRDLAQDDAPLKAAGYMGYKDGRLWITEVAPEEVAERRARLNELASALEERCEVVGGSDLAALEAATRQQLMEVVGAPTAQTAAVASKRNAVLWTDDHLLYELVKGDLPSARVWTQAVFIWAHGKGYVDREQNSRAAARMLRFGYFFTDFNAAVVLDTCEATAWRTEDPDVAAVLAAFGTATRDYSIVLQIAQETIARVWREAPTAEHAKSITARLLTRLADRPDHRRVVTELLQNARALLGLAAPRLGLLEEMLREFLKRGVPYV